MSVGKGPKGAVNRRYNHNSSERSRRLKLGSTFVELERALPNFGRRLEEKRTKQSRMIILKRAMSFIQDCTRGPMDSTDIEEIRAQQAEVQRMISAITAATTSGDFESVASLVDSHLARKGIQSPSSPIGEEEDDEDQWESNDEEEDEASTESDESEGSGDNYSDHAGLA